MHQSASGHIFHSQLHGGRSRVRIHLLKTQIHLFRTPLTKRTPPNRVVFFFCIQRFEQGMSEAKKRPSGAFSARLHRRGITIDATCPVPSIVPLPRKRLTFSATGSVSPLSVSRCGNTASESLLLRQIKPPSFDGGFIFTQRSQRTGLFSLYSLSISPAARTALRTHCAQGQRTLPVSTPFKSLQIVAPLFS